MTVNYNTINSLLQKLGTNNYTKYFGFAGILAEPATRIVLAKLADMPISTDAVPADEIGVEKFMIITRLVNLEKMGLAKSEKVKSDQGYCKKYFINKRGIETVNKLIILNQTPSNCQ